MLPGSENITQGQDLERLIERLHDRNDKECRQARNLLVEIGRRAVPALVNALQNSSNENIRWEVVEALAQMADPIAAPALVQALMDDSQDVRGAAPSTT